MNQHTKDILFEALDCDNLDSVIDKRILDLKDDMRDHLDRQIDKIIDEYNRILSIQLIETTKQHPEQIYIIREIGERIFGDNQILYQNFTQKIDNLKT